MKATKHTLRVAIMVFVLMAGAPGTANAGRANHRSDPVDHGFILTMNKLATVNLAEVADQTGPQWTSPWSGSGATAARATPTQTSDKGSASGPMPQQRLLGSAGVTGFDGVFALPQFDPNFGRDDSTSATPLANPVICVGNGFVLEDTISRVQVFDTSGTPLTEAARQREFNAASLGTPGLLSDTSCQFDPETGRFFTSIMNLNPNSNPVVSEMSVGVSRTGDPRGDWDIYRFPTQDDGRLGTPPQSWCMPPAKPCTTDFARMGLDANGVYIAADESLQGTQFWAIPKRALLAGRTSTKIVNFSTDAQGIYNIDGSYSHRVMPATAPNGDYDRRNGGTEYFTGTLRTGTQPEQNHNSLGVWAMTNTRSLDDPTPTLVLRKTKVPLGYRVDYEPPYVEQSAGGPSPARECLADTTHETPFGTGCWHTPPMSFVLSGPLQTSPAPIYPGEPIVYSLQLSAGQLWLALGTVADVNGAQKVAAGWAVLTPHATPLAFTAAKVTGGVVATDRHLIFPALAVAPSGKAAMAFTVTGQDVHPSVGLTFLDERNGAGPVHVITPGKGQFEQADNDVFSGNARYRWGDFNTATTDGRSLWFGTEYIGNGCTLEEYMASTPFGTCGHTRTALDNWTTRITRVQP